tara:strand:- start:177 stop:629 length:453 start_codon:yes stop_codon:yes gene_type:complete
MEKTKALLGAGCFWGIEELFRKIEGVLDTNVGYAGGTLPNPTYQDVCSGNTGHVEVVKMEFDSNITSFNKILDHFWLCHDPTQLNRQGPDIGTQYRSVIFHFTDEQRIIAEESKNNFQKQLSSKIVTEILQFTNFFEAEDYHQCYIQKNS